MKLRLVGLVILIALVLTIPVLLTLVRSDFALNTN
jgi:hypothetical protein